MISLGLTAAQKADLLALLSTHHSIRVSVVLMNLNHVVEGDISDHLLGGQVNIDVTSGDSTRQAQLELLDPMHRLKLDPWAPQDGSLFMNRMVRVWYHVMPPDRSRRYSIPIFTGPITKASRNGAILSVECLGKEVLSKGNIWVSKTFADGSQIDNAIRYMLNEVAGEAFYDVTESKKKLQNKVTLTKERTVWEVITRLSGMMGHISYYNGMGEFVSRPMGGQVLYTFGEKKDILSTPAIGYNLDGLINSARVKGHKKGKKQAQGSYVAPQTHPLSPYALGRNNKAGDRIRRYHPAFEDDSSLKSNAACDARAKEIVLQSLEQAVDVAFDSLPVVMLEENDLCKIKTDEYVANFRLKKLSIPLTADGRSSVGYLKNVGRPKRHTTGRAVPMTNNRNA